MRGTSNLRHLKPFGHRPFRVRMQHESVPPPRAPQIGPSPAAGPSRRPSAALRAPRPCRVAEKIRGGVALPALQHHRAVALALAPIAAGPCTGWAFWRRPSACWLIWRPRITALAIKLEFYRTSKHAGPTWRFVREAAPPPFCASTCQASGHEPRCTGKTDASVRLGPIRPKRRRSRRAPAWQHKLSQMRRRCQELPAVPLPPLLPVLLLCPACAAIQWCAGFDGSHPRGWTMDSHRDPKLLAPNCSTAAVCRGNRAALRAL